MECEECGRLLLSFAYANSPVRRIGKRRSPFQSASARLNKAIARARSSEPAHSARPGPESRAGRAGRARSGRTAAAHRDRSRPQSGKWIFPGSGWCFVAAGALLFTPAPCSRQGCEAARKVFLKTTKKTEPFSKTLQPITGWQAILPSHQPLKP